MEVACCLIENGANEEDAYLISKISNNAEKNLSLIQDEQFKNIKNFFTASLNFLANKKDYFVVHFQLEGLALLTDNSLIELFLDMLEVCLLQALIKQEDETYISHFYDEQTNKISKNYKNIDHMIDDITQAKIDLLSNANKSLAFDKLLINLLRRWEHE